MSTGGAQMCPLRTSLLGSKSKSLPQPLALHLFLFHGHWFLPFRLFFKFSFFLFLAPFPFHLPCSVPIFDKFSYPKTMIKKKKFIYFLFICSDKCSNTIIFNHGVTQSSVQSKMFRVYVNFDSVMLHFPSVCTG